MRLTEQEIGSIKEAIHKKDPKARVFLFGSRAQSQGAGGDIDLLVESSKLEFPDKLELLSSIKRQIGDQKIDLLITRSLDNDKDPFVQLIRKGAVPL